MSFRLDLSDQQLLFLCMPVYNHFGFCLIKYSLCWEKL